MTSGRNSSVSETTKNEDEIERYTILTHHSYLWASCHYMSMMLIPSPLGFFCDTRASTSLLAEDESATGENALIHGVELGFISVFTEYLLS